MTLPRRQFVSLLLIYCFAVALNPGISARNPSTIVQQNAEDEGLRFRLSEGTDQPEARPATNLAASTSLSNAETEAVLKRLRQSRASPATKQTLHCASSRCRLHEPASR